MFSTLANTSPQAAYASIERQIRRALLDPEDAFRQYAKMGIAPAVGALEANPNSPPEQWIGFALLTIAEAPTSAAIDWALIRRVWEDLGQLTIAGDVLAPSADAPKKVRCPFLHFYWDALFWI